MKVRELIEQLSKLDQKLEVLCYSEDSDLVAPKHLFRLLDIVSVSTCEGECGRGDDQVPSMKFVKNPTSRQYAVLEVTSCF